MPTVPVRAYSVGALALCGPRELCTSGFLPDVNISGAAQAYVWHAGGSANEGLP